MKKVNGLTLNEAKSLAFKAGYEGEQLRMDCAQETWHGISTALGIRNSLIFKCLSAFEGGGGISTEGSCGAVAGALTAFSYYFGRTYDQWQEKIMVFDAANLGMNFISKFKERYGGVTCKDVLCATFGRTFNLRDKAIDFNIFEEMGGHDHKCPLVVAWSAALAVEILWDKIPDDVDLSKYLDFSDY